MRSSTKRILISAQAIVSLVATLGLGACGRSGMTEQLTGPSHDHAGDFAKGPGNAPAPPPVTPPPVIVPPVAGAALKSFTLAPTAVGGGNSSTGSVRIASNAPAGGVTIALASADAATAQVPSTVVVPAGQSRASFPITTIPVATNHTVAINATLNGGTSSATLTVQAPQLATVTLAPASVNAGGGSQGTVTMSSPAVAPGAVIALSSSLPGVASLPASVTIPTGGTSATFAITTVPSLAASSVIITGSLNGVARTATLAVAASNPCQSLLNLGGPVVLATQDVAQFRTGRLRIDLTGDVAAGFINAMGPCSANAAPAATFTSGSATVTSAGGSATATGAPLAFGALTFPVPAEPGTVLATDAAGNVLQVIWPALVPGCVPGPPVLRLNMVAWNPGVHAGSVMDATFSFTARAADGSTAVFTVHGTGMVVPTFVP